MSDDKEHAEGQRALEAIAQLADDFGLPFGTTVEQVATHARYLQQERARLSFAQSAVAAIPVADVRKLLCERCRAGYPFYGDKFEQHIVPSYSGDTYLDCRATEKLHGLPSAPQSASVYCGTCNRDMPSGVYCGRCGRTLAPPDRTISKSTTKEK